MALGNMCLIFTKEPKISANKECATSISATRGQPIMMMMHDDAHKRDTFRWTRQTTPHPTISAKGARFQLSKYYVDHPNRLNTFFSQGICTERFHTCPDVVHLISHLIDIWTGKVTHIYCSEHSMGSLDISPVM